MRKTVYWTLCMFCFVMASAATAQPVTGNLEVSNARVTPSPATSAQSVSVAFTVTNRGPGRGQLARVEVSVNGVVQNSFPSLFVFPNAGDSQGFTAPATMPVVSAGSSTSVTVGVRIFDSVSSVGDFASTFVTVNGPERPDLVPSQPAGWSGPIVVSNVMGTTTSVLTIPFGAAAFVDIAFRNLGGAMQSPGPGVQTQLLLDGQVIFETPAAPLAAGQSFSVSDIQIPQQRLTPGSHTLVLRLDQIGSIQESNETNNESLLQFVVAGPPRPDLAFYVPADWPGSLIVSNLPGTLTPGTLTEGETAFVDVAFRNQGNATAGASTLRYFCNGVETGTVAIASLAAGAVSPRPDLIQLPDVTRGPLTIRIVLDATGALDESNEANNVAQITVQVAPRPCPADWNQDGVVNGDDLGDFINCFFETPPCNKIDFNRDGTIDADDLADFINLFFLGSC